MESGRITGVTTEDYREFYLGGRAASTLSVYKGAFKVVLEHAKDIRVSIFWWDEGEVMGLVVKLAREKKGENMMKSCSAVVNMLFEAAGLEAPTKGASLKKVKVTAVKMMNMAKEKKVKKAITIKDVSRMIRMIYLEGKEVAKERRRFLALMLVTFFGVKRFSDVNKVKVKDVDFKEDGSVEVWMKYSKTDVVGKGEAFKITGRRNKGVSVGKILRWYIRSLKLGLEDYLFCKLGSKGEVYGEDFMRYQEARRSVLQEQKELGLEGLTLHSARVGGLLRRRTVELGGQKSSRQGVGRVTRWTYTCRPRGRARRSAGPWWTGSWCKVGS